MWSTTINAWVAIQWCRNGVPVSKLIWRRGDWCDVIEYSDRGNAIGWSEWHCTELDYEKALLCEVGTGLKVLVESYTNVNDLSQSRTTKYTYMVSWSPFLGDPSNDLIDCGVDIDAYNVATHYRITGSSPLAPYTSDDTDWASITFSANTLHSLSICILMWYAKIIENGKIHTFEEWYNRSYTASDLLNTEVTVNESSSDCVVSIVSQSL
jgi:hypothetical protein